MAKKKRLNVRLDAELIERAKNAIYHLGRNMTVTGLIAEGLAEAVARLEKENGGKPFPAPPKKKKS